MSASKLRVRPTFERLDDRVVMSVAVVAPVRPVPGSHLSANADRSFTSADLSAYARAYLSEEGQTSFAPQYDFNGSGFIGQNDATPILRGLASVTPHIPLKLTMSLAPGQQVTGHHPADSGGVTRLASVTVVGQTTPNSIVFVSNSSLAGNFKFEGAAVSTNAQGEFSETFKLSALSRGGSLTTTYFLIRTPFHQQVIRVFPILRLA